MSPTIILQVSYNLFIKDSTETEFSYTFTLKNGAPERTFLLPQPKHFNSDFIFINLESYHSKWITNKTILDTLSWQILFPCVFCVWKWKVNSEFATQISCINFEQYCKLTHK